MKTTVKIATFLWGCVITGTVIGLLAGVATWHAPRIVYVQPSPIMRTIQIDKCPKGSTSIVERADGSFACVYPVPSNDPTVRPHYASPVPKK